MKKKTSELIKGDIIKTQYGDYDNWVTVIVNYIKHEPNDHIKINCRFYPNGKNDFEMFGYDELEEVIENVNDKRGKE